MDSNVVIGLDIADKDSEDYTCIVVLSKVEGKVYVKDTFSLEPYQNSDKKQNYPAYMSEANSLLEKVKKLYPNHKVIR